VLAAAEIDATLKRIHEGVHEWDTLWDKLEETEVRLCVSTRRRSLPRHTLH
jgi:hypothetical protein